MLPAFITKESIAKETKTTLFAEGPRHCAARCVWGVLLCLLKDPATALRGVSGVSYYAIARDIVVVVVTCYGLDGPGIECR